MNDYILKKSDIDQMSGVDKTHFLNANARRVNRSLGDATGISGFGFHIIELEPGSESTEYHVHYHEDECTYVLEGRGVVTIGDEDHDIAAGDFIGYRKAGLAHTMVNTGDSVLRCIVVGERLAHDVGDYPRQKKRIYRNEGVAWNLVDHEHIAEPTGGRKT